MNGRVIPIFRKRSNSFGIAWCKILVHSLRFRPLPCRALTGLIFATILCLFRDVMYKVLCMDACKHAINTNLPLHHLPAFCRFAVRVLWVNVFENWSKVLDAILICEGCTIIHLMTSSRWDFDDTTCTLLLPPWPAIVVTEIKNTEANVLHQSIYI